MTEKKVRSALGSITELKPGYWRVRHSPYRDKVTGKRAYIEKRVRGSRRDAEAMLAKILVENGENPQTGVTVEVFFENIYLPWIKQKVRPDTYMNYEKDAEHHIIPGIGNMPINDLDPFVIEKWLDSIPKPGARKKTYKTLRQALRQARRWKMIRDVVTDAIPEPKVPHYEPRVLNAREAAEVLEAFKGERIEIAVLLALGCGLRRSEILGLDWPDIRDGEVSVTKSFTVVQGKKIIAEPKTFNSRRVVSIPESFRARIEYLRPYPNSGPVLVGDLGERMHPDVLSKLYETIAAKKGVRFTALKNLRHSHATIMLGAGVDIVTVSRRLGHSSVSITDQYYLRPTRAADQKAADAFDSLGLVNSPPGSH